MSQLSRKKRLIYFIGLTITFILVLPVVILYATGYRLGNISWFDVRRTGGIFIRAEVSGVEVQVDGVIEKKTSFFQRNFLIQDLEPGTHTLSLRVDGYHEWVKKVDVFVEKVTEINPYLVPKKTTLKPLSQYILRDGSVVTATSTSELKKITDKILNPDHVVVSTLFASSSSAVIATSSRDLFVSANFDFADKKGLILNNKLVLWREGNDLDVEWLGNENGIPYYFCSNEVCVLKKEIPVGSQITHFDFYPGRNNYVLVALSDGIYVYEIDDRWSAQNKAMLIPGKNLDFRISDAGVLYMKDGDAIYIADL